MFDGRIYRAALVPLLLVFAIVGFSLASRPAGLRSTLAPDAFDGARAFADLQSLAARFSDRGPGSGDDERLAGYLAQTLSRLGAPSARGVAGGGFRVTERRFRAHTLYGTRTLTNVIAERPGSTGLRPIAIVAHRDATGRGAAAELSGTAALLELARVFSQSETRRTVVLVSTSGGGGDAGAVDFAAHAPGTIDAAIVLGDLAGARMRKPFVLPFSSRPGIAPESLQRTLGAAISQEVGSSSGEPSAATRLAHLAFPLMIGEEAALNAAGIPSVLVQVSGERAPPAGEPVSRARLSSFGMAVLSAAYALDEGDDIARVEPPHVLLGSRLLPAWAVRLLVLALIAPSLLLCVDAFARARRRREPVLRWLGWTLTSALPFFACALFAILLGALDIVSASPGQPSAAALASAGPGFGVLASLVFVLLLGLLTWPILLRRLALPLRPTADGPVVAVLLVLLGVALVVWAVNPYACVLLLPALHAWPLALGSSRPGGSRSRLRALAAILAGLVPLVLLLGIYARTLGLGPVGLAQSATLALAGGQIGLFAALLWSTALGCVLAVSVLASARRPPVERAPREWVEVSTRGPSSYAGPGSLGGTESALRH